MDAAPVQSGRRDTLMVAVDGAVHGLASSDIVEIVRLHKLTRVPNTPASLLGVANLRGTVVPVLSLAALLGRVGAATSAASRLVVVERGTRFAVLVDEVRALAIRSDAPPLDLDALLAHDYAAALLRPAGGQRAHTANAEAVYGAKASRQDERALLTFVVDSRDYALKLEDVTQIIALPTEIAALPGSDATMLGVVAWRDGLLPVVSLRVLLGAPRDGFDRRRARVVVITFAGRPVGLVVDAVQAILRAPASAFSAMPGILTRGRSEARIDSICRLDQGLRLVGVLSPAGLFDAETAARLLGAAPLTAGPDAAQPEVVHDDGGTRRFILFQLAEEHYGLPLAVVDGVARCPASFTRIPRAPDFLAGVMNIRGKAIPVIDQRRLFAAGDGHYRIGRHGAASRVLLISIDRLQAGLLVDDVSEVVDVPTEELRVLPELSASGARLLEGASIKRDGRMFLLVEPAALLTTAQRDVVAAFSPRSTFDSLAQPAA